MQKVTAKQLKKIPKLQVVRKRKHPLVKEILELQKGSALIIPFKEWVLRSDPSVVIFRYSQKTGMKWNKRMSSLRNAWIIKRVK